jgi:hypothetical protein
MKRLSALLFLVLAPPLAQAQVTAPSTWVNDKGSVMSIQTLDTSSSKFAGTYVNKATGFYCQGQPYEMEGSFKANKVDFYVNWKSGTAPNCKTITIWNGRIAGNKITTRWKLYYVGTDWSFHKLTGRDVFTTK